MLLLAAKIILLFVTGHPDVDVRGALAIGVEAAKVIDPLASRASVDLDLASGLPSDEGPGADAEMLDCLR
jgi:hypothetical protein